MKANIKSLVLRFPQLPLISLIQDKIVELEQLRARVSAQESELTKLKSKLIELEIEKLKHLSFGHREESNLLGSSIDNHPWEHPYLSETNIRRFRKYSSEVWEFAINYSQKNFAEHKYAFAVNLAQSMYKWAKISNKAGFKVGLFPSVMDKSALNCPEWEEFDGDWDDILNGDNFLQNHLEINLDVPCYRINMDGTELYTAYQQFCLGQRHHFLQLIAKTPSLRFQEMLAHDGCYPYYQLAKALAEFDAIYTASSPLAAYMSGKPYCAYSVGGDLQIDCGRADDLGRIMSLAFNSAKFVVFTNPHTLGHCRRLGFTNGLYIPYLMDDSRYCPGEAIARNGWEAQYGFGVYILTTARIDSSVKGQSETFFDILINIAKQRPEVRFVFLKWGNDANEFQLKIASSGVASQFVMLPPVGKRKLIDYYRSCDIVLDQFVYGYYGATGLEAAAVGKPIVIKLRKNHYEPWYVGDVAPMTSVDTITEISQALFTLIDSQTLREQKGIELRQWLVRNHGEQKLTNLILAILQITASQVALPKDLVNPLWEDLAPQEKEYHKSLLRR
jgi:glycosyltransferase involved in cell wall biosynthesis